MLKILEPVDAGENLASGEPDDAAFGAICETVRRAPFLAGPLQKVMVRAIKPAERAAPAWRVFPSEREVRFEEMEYEIPAAAGAATLRAAIAEVRRRKLPIIFPFEYRSVAGDEIWLSPMNKGPCISISFHQYAPMPWREAFAAIEPVFRDAGGRPHWAKRHTLVTEDVLRLYPEARRWGEVRRRADPGGKFMNAPLRALFAFSL